MEETKNLVKAAADGDTEAFGEIVRCFRDMAYGYAYSVLGDFDAAQDAAQDAFIEAYQNLDKLRDVAAFPGWFRRVVRYRCSRLMRGKRVATVPLDEAAHLAEPSPTPAEEVERREMSGKVLEAIRDLPPPQREVTTLFYINDYSQGEIADFLEVPVNTVKSRLHASRKRLKERMMDMVEETLAEHRLPDDFAGKVIEGVPTLTWDVSGHTTSVAAMAAALAPTARAAGYDALMVYTGLALRLRIVRRRDGSGWEHGIGPIGRSEEEWEALNRAMGLSENSVGDGDIDEMRRRTVSAIDSVWCPTAWVSGDGGTIYGYEDDGDTVLVRCYDMGEGFHRMSLKAMVESPGGHNGPFFSDPTHEPLSPRDALIEGLAIGVKNWWRGRQPGERWQPWRPAGETEYCFGAWAYEAWIGDLASGIDLLPQHAWVVHHLYDARLAAARFLSANAGFLGDNAQGHLREAASLYVQLGHSIQVLCEGWPEGGIASAASGEGAWDD